jgi:FkbM family methyltransferase
MIWIRKNMENIPELWVDTYKWVLARDVYNFRRFPPHYFDLIIDLGANDGMFSLLARIMNPRATVVALEPDSIPYEKLIHNTLNLRICCEKLALGDGNKRYRLLKDRIGRTMFSPYPTAKTDEEVDSSRLSDVFYKYRGKLSKKYYIKVDCEAGEQWLVGHEASEEILYNAVAVGMKLHFPSVHPNSPRWYNEPWAKPWDLYHEWWQRIFTDHDVVYERSSRKTGYGHLLIDRKGYI